LIAIKRSADAEKRRFLDWIENLPCGIDLMNQDNYRAP
jgi:hypothetical protein